MKITIEEARKIALLSRLEFSAEDLEKMRESMNSILTHMEELNQHDTEKEGGYFKVPKII